MAFNFVKDAINSLLPDTHQQAQQQPMTVKELHERDAAGYTPMMRAAKADDVAEIERLIKLGADVNNRGRDGVTPLWVAANEGKLRAATCLLAHKAQINAENYREFAPIDAAAMAGHTEMVAFLLDNGASVNACTSAQRRETVLMNAAKAGRFGVVRLLVERGADIALESKDGHTALAFARNNNHIDVSDYLLPLYRLAAVEKDGLTSVQLSFICIEDGEAKVIMDKLPPSVRKIQMRGNKITDVGAKIIADCISVHPIEELDLSKNLVTEYGWQHFNNALKTCITLTKLEGIESNLSVYDDVQSKIARNIRLKWKEMHEYLRGFCLALAPLQLPSNALLTLFGWLPTPQYVDEVAYSSTDWPYVETHLASAEPAMYLLDRSKKLRVIDGVLKSRAAVLARRPTASATASSSQQHAVVPPKAK